VIHAKYPVFRFFLTVVPRKAEGAYQQDPKKNFGKIWRSEKRSLERYGEAARTAPEPLSGICHPILRPLDLAILAQPTLALHGLLGLSSFCCFWLTYILCIHDNKPRLLHDRKLVPPECM
jgi:hypothetical protein